MASIRIAKEAVPQQPYGLATAEYGTLWMSEILAGERRLEAGVYLSDGLAIRRAIAQSTVPTRLLGTMAKIWQPGRGVGVQVGPEHGVPYLAATQVFDVWPASRKRLASPNPTTLASLYVEPNWVLVTCSGTVGRAILAYTAHKDFAVSSDLLRVKVEGDPVLRSYVYGFMRSRLGHSMMEGSHYGSIVKHLRPAHLQTLPIPVLTGAVMETVHEEVKSAFELRDRAYRLDVAARELFSNEMSERSMMRSEEGYSLPAAILFGGRRRLEASAHSPQAQFVTQIYERNSRSMDTLGAVAHAFLPNRFKRIYGENGVSYLDSEPIFKVNPALTKSLTLATKINFSDYMVQRGWLLMARSGQVYGINGQAILANEWHEQKVITEHIMRIIPNREKIQPGYLQTVLSHPLLGKPLVVSRAFGTSVPELATQDIEALPIPRLDSAKETQIAEAAEEANVMRYEADCLENSAVTTLETALFKRLKVIDNS